MELVGCSNPGFSYTKNTINNLNELIRWLDENDNSQPMTYKQMQESVEAKGGNLDGSAVRMIIPFFRKAGLVKDELFEHVGRDIDFSNIFTDSGKCFIQFLRVYIPLRENDDEVIKKQLSQIFEKFVLIQYSFLIKKSQKVYGGIIEFLKKYKTMDKNEFFMLTTILDKNQKVSTSTELESMVYSYRKKEIDSSEIKILKNVNAYGYIIPFLKLYNIIRDGNDYIFLNKKYENLFDEILREGHESE